MGVRGTPLLTIIYYLACDLFAPSALFAADLFAVARLFAAYFISSSSLVSSPLLQLTWMVVIVGFCCAVACAFYRVSLYVT